MGGGSRCLKPFPESSGLSSGERPPGAPAGPYGSQAPCQLCGRGEEGCREERVGGGRVGATLGQHEAPWASGGSDVTSESVAPWSHAGTEPGRVDGVWGPHGGRPSREGEDAVVRPLLPRALGGRPTGTLCPAILQRASL